MVEDRTELYREFGDERLPPGQHRTESFPVLSKGNVPRVTREEWSLSVRGAVEDPVTLDWEAFTDLGVETQRQDFHCVTGWSRFDCAFTGVSLATVADHVGVESDAVHVRFHAADDYTTDLPLDDALRPETLLAFEFDGDPLPRDHGGPVRVVTPHKYAYKGAKWVTGVEFHTEPVRGFWEKRGYSVTANPWREERYG
ncbi:molybdopterin-dependent oxidoreductase [Haloplanus halophilus]|uniref:molybdopterin-dependent oxidoreductase n=1 Tax=Haloplanus halophilus TaxID=2949993 RepID=UPI0020408819|nr:molybdopterin-dependent oxidoreductase [Haloplanus sp. GDY1]